MKRMNRTPSTFGNQAAVIGKFEETKPVTCHAHSTGGRYLGLHAARHPQLKTLRAAGLPNGVIAARLGHHETVIRTLHGVPDDQQQAAAAVMAQLLGQFVGHRENVVRDSEPPVFAGGFHVADHAATFVVGAVGFEPTTAGL